MYMKSNTGRIAIEGVKRRKNLCWLKFVVVLISF